MFFHLTIFWNKIPKNTVLLKGQLIYLFKLKQEKPKALRAPSTIFFKEDNMNIYHLGGTPLLPECNRSK